MLSSCVSNTKNYGYDQYLNNFDKLKVGRSTKDSVVSIVGSPSTVSAFSDNEWYYVTIKTKKVSFFKANVIGHMITKLQFKGGLLVKMTSYDSDKKQPLEFNKQESPIQGHESGIVKDLFYNMGRFNKGLNKKE